MRERTGSSATFGQVRRSRFLAAVMGANLLVGLVVAPAWASHPTSHVQPTFEEGNVTCSDFFDTSGDVFEAKVEPVSSGVKTVGDFQVLITVKNTADGQVFDYQILSAHVAHGVVVKGGPDANLYDYDAAELSNIQSDVDLHSPVNKQGRFFGLSHISFCVEEAPVFVEAELSGVKYLDEDEDGVFDAGEATLAGWRIDIYDFSGGEQGALLESVVTDAQGEWTYVHPPVLEGTELRFLVCEEQQNGWQQTGPNTPPGVDMGSLGICYDVTVTANEGDELVSGLDFGNIIELAVEKTAATELTRTWTWDIDKDADQTTLELEEGESATVNYTVEVSATSADSDHRAFGTIVVTNPSPDFSATIQTVTDNQADSVVCDETLPHVLGPGDSLTCDWETATNQNGSNTATVTATGGFTGGSASASWNFNDADITEVDRCVDVSDTHVGLLEADLCAPADGLPFSKTYNYSLTIGNDPDADIFVDCGRTVIDNTAMFVTDDTGTIGTDDHTVIVDVICVGEGCTPGFWRNHLDLWEGYDPSDVFDAVFGVSNSVNAGLTLEQAINMGGGGERRLIRHATAALLNAAHSGVDYAFSEAQVIEMVQDAYVSGNFNAAADPFEAANEEGCPIP